MIAYAQLALPFDAAATQQVLAQTVQQWQQHYNVAYFEGGWTVLPLRSPGGMADNIVADLTHHQEYQDTVYLQYFPAIQQLLAQMQCPVMSVRLLNLQAGAVIKTHRDHELAFEKGEARLHFPVITNPDVEFYIKDERIVLAEGECWYINANLPHRVSNNGATNRIHLVIDCLVNDWLREQMQAAITIKQVPDQSPQELEAIIKQLRLQNTPTANQLADNLQQQLDHYPVQ